MNEIQALWSAFLGAVLPLLIAVIQQPQWSKQARTIVAVVVCAIAGAVQAYLDGKLASGVNVVSAIMIVTMAALTFYRNVWKPLGATGAIERATSSTHQ